MEASRSLTSSRSHTPSSSSVPAHNAALTGALLAFNKSAAPSTTSAHHAVTKPSDGALSASQSLYTTSTTAAPAAPAALTPAHSGSSSYFGFLQQRSNRGHNELTPDESGPVSRATSPSSTLSRTTSFTAATLAAARYQGSTPSRTPSRAQPTNASLPLDARALALQRRLDERKVARELAFTMDEKPDRTSIEPTKSLVSLFEQQSGTPGTVKPAISRQLSLAKGKPPPILAPKPTRTLSVQSVSPELQNKPDVAAKPKPLLPKKPSQNGSSLSKGISTTAPSVDRPTTKAQTQKPDAPAPRRASKRPSKDTHNADTASAPPPQLSRFGLPLPTTNRLTPRPPSVPPNARVTPSNPQRTSPTYKDTSINMLTPHMTGDSLANAMVGANLAFRSPSPAKRSKTPPPVPGPRRKQHVHGIDMLQGGRARSLSPQKKQPGKLLSTLRTDEADEKHKNRKHHFRQPNKHHEGTRERWRDYVSDSERKRYEGVWAANKGLYISSSANADEVLNLVVRDIWSRSRLPPEKLGKVWDLVAVDDEAENGESGQKRRSLTREQFVVGLWLIDQVLKGRNLPHNVNASVWTSVRLMGVKVRLEGKGKDGRKLERGTAW